MGGYELSGAVLKRKVGLRTICVIAGGILIQLSLGSAYTFGNLVPYMVSYLRNRTDDTDIRNIDALWVTSVGSVGNCFGMTIGGIVDRQFGPRIAAGLGCLIFSGAVTASYFCVKTAFIALVLTYGFLNNFGNLMAYGVTVQTAIKWLPQRPTLASGLTLCGFGGGALIFNPVITAYINPDNLSPDLETDDGDKYFTDPDLLDRVPTCFLMQGGIFLAMQLIGLIFIANPTDQDVVVTVGMSNPALAESRGHIESVSEKVPEQKVLDNFDPATSNGNVKTENENNDTRNSEVISVKAAIKEALKSGSFYIVFFTVMTITGGMELVSSLYKAYGQTFIDDDLFLALVGTLASIFNCLGRPFWGMVMDRFGFRFTLRCISIGLGVCTGTIILTEHINKEFFMVWICLAYFFYCGTWSVCPSTLAKLFSVRNMAINYGFIQIALVCISAMGDTGMASLIVSVFAVTLKDTIGYHGIFYMSCGMFVFPFLLTFIFKGIDTTGRPI